MNKKQESKELSRIVKDDVTEDNDENPIVVNEEERGDIEEIEAAVLSIANETEEDDLESVSEVVGGDGKNDDVLVSDHFEYFQEVRLVKVDYDVLFDYLGKIAPIKINEWEFIYAVDGREDEFASTPNQFTNEMMDKLVATQKMDQLLGTRSYIPPEVRERYDLLSRMSMYFALFQIKYELWPG